MLMGEDHSPLVYSLPGKVNGFEKRADSAVVSLNPLYRSKAKVSASAGFQKVSSPARCAFLYYYQENTGRQHISFVVAVLFPEYNEDVTLQCG